MEAKSQASAESVYYKVLVGLLVLTAVTLIQPGMFLTDYTMATQLFIAVVKAWLIVMYYMHLKGEKLIGILVLGTLFIVSFFFIIVLGFDVVNFQFQDISPISKDAFSAVDAVSTTHEAAHTVSTTHEAAHAVSHH